MMESLLTFPIASQDIRLMGHSVTHAELGSTPSPVSRTHAIPSLAGLCMDSSERTRAPIRPQSKPLTRWHTTRSPVLTEEREKM